MDRIIKTSVTIRDVGTSVDDTLRELRQLNEDWYHAGRVGNIEIFRLYVSKDE